MTNLALDNERVKTLESQLSEFHQMNSPIFPVITVTITLFAISYGILTVFENLHGKPLGLFSENSAPRILLAIYACSFSAIWITYFISRYEILFSRVRTLRNLLLTTSDYWSHSDVESGEDSFTEGTRRKATSSIMMLSMLTASSILILIQSLNRSESFAENDYWQQLLLYGSASAAAIAFICFVVSADSLDSTYNRFSPGAGRARRHMIRFFYTNTRTTRYLGVMFILAAIFLYASSFGPIFGSFVVAVIISTGWTHWFPNPPLISNIDLEEPDVQNPGGILLWRTLWRVPIIFVPPVFWLLC